MARKAVTPKKKKANPPKRTKPTTPPAQGGDNPSAREDQFIRERTTPLTPKGSPPPAIRERGIPGGEDALEPHTADTRRDLMDGGRVVRAKSGRGKGKQQQQDESHGHSGEVRAPRCCRVDPRCATPGRTDQGGPFAGAAAACADDGGRDAVPTTAVRLRPVNTTDASGP